MFTGQLVIFDPNIEIKRKLTELQQWVEEPSEAELLAENLQAINTQFASNLEDAWREVKDSILKHEELINHYETHLQDKQAILDNM